MYAGIIIAKSSSTLCAFDLLGPQTLSLSDLSEVGFCCRFVGRVSPRDCRAAGRSLAAALSTHRDAVRPSHLRWRLAGKNLQRKFRDFCRASTKRFVIALKRAATLPNWALSYRISEGNLFGCVLTSPHTLQALTKNDGDAPRKLMRTTIQAEESGGDLGGSSRASSMEQLYGEVCRQSPMDSEDSARETADLLSAADAMCCMYCNTLPLKQHQESVNPHNPG